MSALEGLLLFALAVVAWWVLSAVIDAIDHWPGRRLIRPGARPAQRIPPPLPGPPAWGHADHRHTRPPGPGGPGRHRAPEGDT